MSLTALNLTVRVGCSLAYETTVPTPVLFVLKPRLEGRVLVMQEKLSFGIGLPAYEFQDSHGNMTCRSVFMPGRNEISHDALVAVSSLPDSREVPGQLLPVGQLPFELLRYTLPSRYCDSDKLLNFAWNQFGRATHGLPRVQAICDWVHNNIENASSIRCDAPQPFPTRTLRQTGEIALAEGVAATSFPYRCCTLWHGRLNETERGYENTN